MEEYSKIQTIFHRDPLTKNKSLIEGVWSHPAFEYLQNNEWLFTEKIDGTNIRITFTGDDVIFNGKTNNAQIPATLVRKLINLFPLDLFKELPPLTLYGEGYGKGIRSGGNYIRDDVNFILFDIWIDGWWLERANIEDIASKLNINTVPIIGRGTLIDAYNKTAEGFQSAIADCIAEGIVMRPSTMLFDRKGKCIITKIKHKDFKTNE